MVAPATEGALAPDPSRATPPARGKAGPIREIPALRKREKSEPHWKDEVRERVQRRKRKPKAASNDLELPIFGEPDAPRGPAVERAPDPQPAVPPEPVDVPIPEPASVAEVADPGDFVRDLEIRAPEPVAEIEAPEPEQERELQLRPSGPLKLDIPEPEAYDPLSEEPESAEEQEPARREDEDDEWRLDEALELSDAHPVERPAQFAERLEAGAVDAALLGGLASVVVYFASRAAHVPVEGLLPVWPWLSGYLALLALSYAAYFTGTTGQTPGKMLFGLRVVEASGGPPSYPRAFGRAAAGALGSLLAGAFVLPLFFDPARRALHDRLFHTRVVKY